MASILVVHDHSDRAIGVARTLSEGGHVVRESLSRDEALTALRKEPPDLVLCEARAVACAGADGWVATLRRVAPSSAALFLVPDEPAECDAALTAALRAPNVVWGTYSPTNVLELARRTLDARRGFQGTVSGLGLIEVLQMFHLSRRSARLYIDGSPSGWIEFDRGEVVDATSGDASGTEAVRVLLGARDGRFRTASRSNAGRRTIDQPFDRLMMLLLRGDATDDTGSSEDPFAGLDALRSWAPASLSVAAPSLKAPSVVTTPMAQRWADAHGDLGRTADNVLVVLVQCDLARATVLHGTDARDVAEPVMALARALAAATHDAPTAVIEHLAAGQAFALLWSRDENSALWIASAVAPAEASRFRAYVLGVARNVLVGAEAATGEDEGT